MVENFTKNQKQKKNVLGKLHEQLRTYQEKPNGELRTFAEQSELSPESKRARIGYKKPYEMAPLFGRP